MRKDDYFFKDTLNMKNKNKGNISRKSIVHVALGHNVEDSRVFYRECVSLSKSYNVTLICSGNETGKFTKDGVHVLQIKHRTFPLLLIHSFLRSVCVSGVVYHAQDVPGLILSFLLKLIYWNRMVIFDVHEYYDAYAFDKRKKLNKRGKIFNKIYTLLLKPVLPRLCRGIITICPIMSKDYIGLNSNIEVIYNFPKSSLLEDIKSNDKLDPKYDYLVYHGGIKEDRGIMLYPRLLKALEDEKVRLLIMGDFKFENLRTRFDDLCKELNIEHRVITTGQLLFKDTISYLKNKVRFIGLTLFTYQEDHKKAINQKIFESLYLGMPQVGSDYRIYFKKFILDNKAGLGADFHNIESQVKAVKHIFSNYDEYKNRCLEIRNDYIWETEENKLFNFYKKLLDS